MKLFIVFSLYFLTYIFNGYRNTNRSNSRERNCL